MANLDLCCNLAKTYAHKVFLAGHMLFTQRIFTKANHPDSRIDNLNCNG
jgi:hypothetical protein